MDPAYSSLCYSQERILIWQASFDRLCDWFLAHNRTCLNLDSTELAQNEWITTTLLPSGKRSAGRSSVTTIELKLDRKFETLVSSWLLGKWKSCIHQRHSPLISMSMKVYYPYRNQTNSHQTSPDFAMADHWLYWTQIRAVAFWSFHKSFKSFTVKLRCVMSCRSYRFLSIVASKAASFCLSSVYCWLRGIIDCIFGCSVRSFGFRFRIGILSCPEGLDTVGFCGGSCGLCVIGALVI